MATKKAASKKRKSARKAKPGASRIARIGSAAMAPRTQLISVTIEYCLLATGERKKRNLNLNKYKGLIWRREARPADFRVEGFPDPPENTGRKCSATSDPDPTCCYWTGNSWSCPDDWE